MDIKIKHIKDGASFYEGNFPYECFYALAKANTFKVEKYDKKNNSLVLKLTSERLQGDNYSVEISNVDPRGKNFLEDILKRYKLQSS